MDSYSRVWPVAASLLVLTTAALACNAPWQGDQGPGEDPGQPGGLTETSTEGQGFNGFAAVVGPEETVFDWTADKCETTDVPDLPARAFLDHTGQVQLIASIDRVRRFIGPDLDSLTHPCEIVMESDLNSDPSLFNDHEWIAGTYTEDGLTIHALVHNEYHGWERSGHCSVNILQCWYNSITQVVSTDGGASYDHLPAPSHLVAALPYLYEEGKGPYGLMEPSNIIKGRDGYYYAMVRADGYASEDQHICLLRTDDLSQPGSWRAWDGDGFDMAFFNPYPEPPAPPEEHICAPIGYDQINNMDSSITYNTFMNKYVLIGSTGQNYDDRLVWGFFYSFSDDLIHWSDRQLLIELPLGGVVGLHGPDVYAYPSLLDPESSSRNFETAGKRAYIYYTHMRIESGAGFWDRDLVRFPVEFFKTEPEARAADARTSLSVEGTPTGDTLQVEGRLSTLGGQPVSGAVVEIAAVPQDGIVGEYTLTGIVPAGAREAPAVVRINSECNCSGSADLSIYEITYREGDSGTVQRRDFSAGLRGAVWGVADVKVEASDQGSGRMLHIIAPPDKDARFNSLHFAVTPGATYTFTVRARVSPASEGSGYFALIFLGRDNQEVERPTIPLTPQVFDLGRATTGTDGGFELTANFVVQAGTIQARFPGDERLWPTESEGFIP